MFIPFKRHWMNRQVLSVLARKLPPNDARCVHRIAKRKWYKIWNGVMIGVGRSRATYIRYADIGDRKNPSFRNVNWSGDERGWGRRNMGFTLVAKYLCVYVEGYQEMWVANTFSKRFEIDFTAGENLFRKPHSWNMFYFLSRVSIRF